MIRKKVFEQNKKQLDGYIFWRDVGEMVQVKQVIPSKIVSNLIITLKMF